MCVPALYGIGGYRNPNTGRVVIERHVTPGLKIFAVWDSYETFATETLEHLPYVSEGLKNPEGGIVPLIMMTAIWSLPQCFIRWFPG